MMNLWSNMVDILYPRTCAGCGISVQEAGMALCWDCRSSLSVISYPFCSTCGEPVHGRVDHAYSCHVCTKNPPLYGRARAALHYNALGKRLVSQFKYHHALWLEHLLVQLLETCVRTHYEGVEFDGICAVPLHHVKRRERGFNQSQLIAKSLSRRIGKSLLGCSNLKRIRPTTSQTRLTARQRITNVMGTFEVSCPAEFLGKHILLVDDVMTTGATVGACAQALLKAGAARVDVATVARGI